MGRTVLRSGPSQYMSRKTRLPYCPCRCLIRDLFSKPDSPDLWPKGPALANDKVRIRFEGRTLEVRPDTSVAVGLWENGIRHLSHSPKYGLPRGVTCARGHCTACLMRIDGVPNVRSCELPVREGMDIRRQDAGAFYAAPMQKTLALGASFFPVGFYFKWFTRPAALSRFFLERIRPLTGVGRVPGPEHARPPLREAAAAGDTAAAPAADLGRFDTVVVGAGPSGLAAAARAAGSVLILDDHSTTGGQRYGALRHLADHAQDVLDRFGVLGRALARVEDARSLAAGRDGVTFRAGARAIAGYHPDGLLVRTADRLATVRFDSLVWAAGALDTLGLFPGNDTPGVVGPRALYRLLVRDGMVVKGRRVLVIGSGLDFWLSAALLASRGARLELVATAADDPAEISAAAALRWPLHTGRELAEVNGLRDGRLKATFTRDRSADGGPDSRLEMDADLAVVCRRGKPAYDVPYQLGADLRLQPERGGFVLPADGDSEPGCTRCTLPGGAILAAAGEAAGHPPGRPLGPAGEGAES